MLVLIGLVINLCLLIPLVTGYGIFPGYVTPYWLFTFIFFAAIGLIGYYLYLSNRGRIQSERLRIIAFISSALSVFIIFLVMWTAIANRGFNAPGQNYQVHDIILQLEAALRYLSDGRNPYSETYFGTPMEKWNYDELGKPAVNPALYHFVMPPWYLLFSYPFYFISMRVLGYFDGRMPLLIAVIGIAVLIWISVRKINLKHLAIAAIILNPANVAYLVEGRSDYLVFFFLLGAVNSLFGKLPYVSAVLLGLAVTTKQTAWFIAPIILGVVFYTMPRRKFWFYFGLFMLTVAIICGPFLVWDYRAFLDSVVFYLNGNTAHGYPVSGYGLGMLLYSTGFIRDIHAYYPFIVWQLVLGIPALYIGLKYILQKPVMSRVFAVHGLTLFIFWYTSRYFNNSHLGYISLLLLVSAIYTLDENERYD